MSDSPALSAAMRVAPSPGKFPLGSVRAMVVNGMSAIHTAAHDSKPFVYLGEDGEGGSLLMFPGVVAFEAEHVAALAGGAVHCFHCGKSAAWPAPPLADARPLRNSEHAPGAQLFGIRSKSYALYLTVFLNKFAAQHVGCKKEETE